MMCEECGERAATFHLTTISGGEKVERNLCPVCMAKYQKKLPGIDFGNLAGMLAGIMNATKAAAEKQSEAPAATGLVCEKCGTTYESFQKTGMLGCAACYQAFREPLEEMLNRIHGNVQHTGKVPGGVRKDVSLKLSIDRLKQQLVKAIADEAYEDAATYRDQIRALTQQLEAAQKAEADGAKEGVTE